MSQPTNVILESAPCPFECSSGDEVVCVGSDNLHGMSGQFPVTRCAGCGLMRTDPRPSPETIGLFYPDNYGPYMSTAPGVEQQDRSRRSPMRMLISKAFRKVFEFNTTRLPDLPPGEMLEIGCASGSFLDEMAARGWRVRGIEFSTAAAKTARARGHHVYSGPLETAPAPDGAFDLVVGWMVLEHLHQPIEGLRKLKGWVKPGAYLVLSVPNAGSLEFSIFKNNWYALHLPNHLYHFTPDSLELVLRAGGWRLEKIHHQRVISNLIGSVGLWLIARGFRRVGGRLVEFPDRSGRWSYLLFPIAWIFSLAGQTGRMTVWARATD